MTDDDQTLRDRAADLLTEAQEGRQVHRSQSATENISTSMDGWRETFEGMPNWVTNLVDVAFVVVGLVLVLQLGTAGTLVGAIVMLLGAVGIADAIYQRVRPWFRRWR